LFILERENATERHEKEEQLHLYQDEGSANGTFICSALARIDPIRDAWPTKAVPATSQSNWLGHLTMAYRAESFCVFRKFSSHNLEFRKWHLVNVEVIVEIIVEIIVDRLNIRLFKRIKCTIYNGIGKIECVQQLLYAWIIVLGDVVRVPDDFHHLDPNHFI
jgi:hypothetical protein